MAATKIVKYHCKIMDIRAPGDGNVYIDVEFNDGGELGPWVQNFMFPMPDRPISLEEFMKDLRSRHIERPQNPLAYLNQSLGKPFELQVEKLA